MVEGLEIREAEPGDASDIAEIHLAARMPYLHRPHTDDETREYFGRVGRSDENEPDVKYEWVLDR